MLNKVILMGRLTADPQMRQTSNGVSMCRFSVAVDRPFTSKETGQREADFINVVAWRATADFVGRFFSKGSMIIVEGALRNNNYTDQNGVKHYAMDVLADNVSFGESKRAREANQNAGGFQTGNFPQSNNAPYQNNNYNSYNNNSYNQSNDGFGGNSGYQAQPANQGFNNAPATPAQNSDSSLQLGDLGDFEEIISDGEVPF
jgi:single-strand DNA-binding protein